MFLKVYGLLGLIMVLLYVRYVIPDMVADIEQANPQLRIHGGAKAFAMGLVLLSILLVWPVFAVMLYCYLRLKQRRAKEDQP